MNRKRIGYYLSIISIIVVLMGLLYIAYNNFYKKELAIINQDKQVSYYVTISSNGADRLEKVQLKCTMSKEGCLVTLPVATRNDGIVLGYSDDALSKVAKYQIGETISVNSDMKLYVISMKTNMVYIENNDVDFLEKDILKCSVYNTEKNCSVLIPKYNKIGYENRGYSTSRSSLSGFIFPGEEYKISKDVTLYPLYSEISRKKYDVDKTMEYNNSIVEIENGCKEKVYSTYLQYLNEIKTYAPYLLFGSKISFITDETFDRTWGSQYVGMNYGILKLRSVDIRCTDKYVNDFYATMVHEMTHSWDFYYAARLGDNISNQNDVINMYNKYIEIRNRPFREYSYSNKYEFVADMMRYYYLKYYVPRAGFMHLTYPQDIKNTMEKYICIGKNDYDTSRCRKVSD